MPSLTFLVTCKHISNKSASVLLGMLLENKGRAAGEGSKLLLNQIFAPNADSRENRWRPPPAIRVIKIPSNLLL
jgi:hypothetical protein